MADKGEGYTGYQDLKSGIYHGYQPLPPRKTPKFTAEYAPSSGMLNIAMAKDIESIPSGQGEDQSQAYIVSAHKIKRDTPAEQPLTGN